MEATEIDMLSQSEVDHEVPFPLSRALQRKLTETYQPTTELLRSRQYTKQCEAPYIDELPLRHGPQLP